MSGKPSNRVLLHILKNTPKNGEIYLTWEDETFVGLIQQIEITRRPDEPAMFSVSGYINDRL